jgi:hypothetical protein
VTATPTARVLIPHRNRSRHLLAVAVEKPEYVRVGAPIDPKCSAEGMELATEEGLHGALHKHLFQLLNTADRAQLWGIHIELIVEARRQGAPAELERLRAPMRVIRELLVCLIISRGVNVKQ